MPSTVNAVPADNAAAGTSATTVRELRRRWKPHKERLGALRQQHPTNIRFHRACSWLQRAEEIDSDLDLRLITLWIAFNALYGRWDPQANQPCGERGSWPEFLDRILKLDRGEVMGDVLQEHKRLVMSLLEDEFLSEYFWQEPTRQRAGRSRRAKHQALTWYLDGNWTKVLDEVFERIYLLRCQLIHGAATHGSKLNRTSLRRSAIMLDHLIRRMLSVFAESGAEEDWGDMCYPPLQWAGTGRSPRPVHHR